MEMESIFKAIVYGRSQGEEPGDMVLGLKEIVVTEDWRSQNTFCLTTK